MSKSQTIKKINSKLPTDWQVTDIGTEADDNLWVTIDLTTPVGDRSVWWSYYFNHHNTEYYDDDHNWLGSPVTLEINDDEANPDNCEIPEDLHDDWYDVLSVLSDHSGDIIFAQEVEDEIHGYHSRWLPKTPESQYWREDSKFIYHNPYLDDRTAVITSGDRLIEIPI